jgi:hypothetical protein
LFSNSALSVFGQLSRGPALRLAITRIIWSEHTQAWWPPWVSLALSTCGRLSRSSLPSHCSENHLIWVDFNQTVPLAFKINFKMVHIYCSLCSHCIFSISTRLDSILFFCLFKHADKMYSWYFDPVINNHLRVDKHHTIQDSPTFISAQGFFEGLLLPCGTNFSNWGRGGWDSSTIGEVREELL